MSGPPAVTEAPTRSHAEAVLAFLLEMDDALARAGFPPLSDYWRAEVERFYRHPTAKTWPARVGRGGAKSTAICKVAVAETLAGRFQVPRGEVHWFALVSENVTEAAQRLRLIDEMLTAIRFPHEKDGSDAIVLTKPGWERRGFRVRAARIGAVSGFRALGLAMDEVAKWRDGDTSVNPAAEIAASANAMLVTHPEARRLIFSSPLGAHGYHYDAVERGETEQQIVSVAPSWVANPAISEARTHELEPDERIWRREYLAEPQAGQLGCFELADVERAFVPRERGAHMGVQAIVLDWASGKKDRITWGSFGFEQTRPTVMRFTAISGMDAAEARALGSTAVVQKIVSFARHLGLRVVHGDQRESFTLRGDFAACGIEFREHVWTAQSKVDAIEALRRYFREDRMRLPVHERLRRELLNFEEKITASGSFTFGARGNGHDDYVALLITGAMIARRGAVAAQARAAYAAGSPRANAIGRMIAGDAIAVGRELDEERRARARDAAFEERLRDPDASQRQREDDAARRASDWEQFLARGGVHR